MNSDDQAAMMLLLEEEDWGIWHKCPVKECPRTFPNFAALISHLKRDHPGALPS